MRCSAPSRDEKYNGVRLKPELFRHLSKYVPSGQAFTHDLFGSWATAHVPLGWEDLPEPDRYLPYFSRGPDPGSAGVNCFAQDVRECEGGGEMFGFANPPLVLARAAVAFVRESRARALFVLSPPSGVAPPWWTEMVVGDRLVWECPLPEMNSEFRDSLGTWVDVAESRRVPLTAYLLDFRGLMAGETSGSSPSYSPLDPPAPDSDSD